VVERLCSLPTLSGWDGRQGALWNVWELRAVVPANSRDERYRCGREDVRLVEEKFALMGQMVVVVRRILGWKEQILALFHSHATAKC